ncbi:MAG TPA: SDR family oxidoreductase [Acidimicrobiales bacterium]|nr:SDR family oxidoreductase [Acidimicrobiales bacterium]
MPDDGPPTAVVTGGGSGIGAACAARLAEAGNMVVLVGRRPEPLEEVADAIGSGDAVAHAFPADIRDWDRLGELRDTITGWSGRVDVLVNAAGGQFHSPAEQLTPNAWRAVVDTNLTGTFFVCRQLFPLLSRRGGAIVNVVASVWQRPFPGMAHSGAARAGVVNLTRTLALEWATHGIRVNALSPGFTDTPAFRSQVGDLSGPAARVPLRRLASADEVADAAMFLARSTYTTGEVLTVDGGFQLT